MTARILLAALLLASPALAQVETHVRQYGTTSTAAGYAAMPYLTTGVGNTAFGATALHILTTGHGNTAFGFEALQRVTSGGANVAVGPEALYTLSTGGGNVAVGQGAGNWLTGTYNTLVGCESGFFSDSTWYNTGVGMHTLQWYGSGSHNVAVGAGTLYGVDGHAELGTGQYNTAVGDHAGYQSPAQALYSGERNTFLGAVSGLASDEQLDNTTTVGYGAYVSADDTVVLGDELVTHVLAGSEAQAVVQAAGYEAGGMPGLTATIEVQASRPCSLTFVGGLLVGVDCHGRGGH